MGRKIGTLTAALSVTVILASGAAMPALAQPPPAVDAAAEKTLLAALLSTIKSLPNDTTEDVYEAQLNATLEANPNNLATARQAILDAIATPGLSKAAVEALRALLKKRYASGALDIGFAGNGPQFDFGPGSDYGP